MKMKHPTFQATALSFFSYYWTKEKKQTLGTKIKYGKWYYNFIQYKAKLEGIFIIHVKTKETHSYACN